MKYKRLFTEQSYYNMKYKRLFTEQSFDKKKLKQEYLEFKKFVTSNKLTESTIKLNEGLIPSGLKDKFSFTELMTSPEKRISTRKQNQIIAFNQDFLTETAQKGENLWGLFSGMTRFTTHSMNRDTTENKMFGSLGERERKVFNVLAEMVQ